MKSEHAAVPAVAGGSRGLPGSAPYRSSLAVSQLPCGVEVAQPFGSLFDVADVLAQMAVDIVLRPGCQVGTLAFELPPRPVRTSRLMASPRSSPTRRGRSGRGEGGGAVSPCPPCLPCGVGALLSGQRLLIEAQLPHAGQEGGSAVALDSHRRMRLALAETRPDDESFVGDELACLLGAIPRL